MNQYFRNSLPLGISTSGQDAVPSLSKKPKQNFPIFTFLLVGFVILVLYFMSERPFIEYDREGNPTIAKWRKEKLAKELDDLDNAEQYALKAVRAGWYPCYNCGQETRIYLFPREIWRYGTTTKGEKGRYRRGLSEKKLVYVTEYHGTLQECLKQEKIKIYNYPLFPENFKRKPPIMRPPGNKIDR